MVKKSKPSLDYSCARANTWETLSQEEKRCQILEVILSPCWSRLSRQSKKRWLAQYQRHHPLLHMSEGSPFPCNYPSMKSPSGNVEE
jgi:hypothetical protein